MNKFSAIGLPTFGTTAKLSPTEYRTKECKLERRSSSLFISLCLSLAGIIVIGYMRGWGLNDSCSCPLNHEQNKPLGNVLVFLETRKKIQDIGRHRFIIKSITLDCNAAVFGQPSTGRDITQHNINKLQQTVAIVAHVQLMERWNFGVC